MCFDVIECKNNNFFYIKLRLATKKTELMSGFLGGTDGTNKVFFNSAVIQSVGVGFAAFGGQMGDKSRFVSFYTLCRRQ